MKLQDLICKRCWIWNSFLGSIASYRFELVHTLIKYTQGKDVYICDFVEAIKMCKVKLYELYINHECKFKDEAFNAFHSLLVGKHDGLPLLFIN
jgi:hypothetical protein